MNKLESIQKAIEYTQNKDFKNAEKIYLTLLDQNPKDEPILEVLGLLYMQLGKLKKAEKTLEKAFGINKSYKIIPHLAKVKTYLGKYTESLYLYIEIVKEQKTLENYKELIQFANKCDNNHAIYKFAIEAHEIFPFEAYFIEQAAYSAVFVGKYKEAESLANRCMRLKPKSTIALKTLGLLQEVLYCNEENARKYYKQIVKYGDLISGYQALSTSYQKEKQHKKLGFSYLKKAARLTQIDPFGFAQYYLSQRQFKKGYRYYIIKIPRSHDDYLWLKRFKTRWDGKKHPNETLLVYGDQGIGDQLMFARYIPFLQKKFKQIKVVMHSSLITIVKRSFKHCKNVKFYPNKNIMRLPLFDKSVQLSHLPYFLNINFNHIPTPEGYLIPNNKQIEEYKTKLFDTDKLKIGICWEAGAIGIHEQIHRILNVELFENIINTPNAQVYSFQVKPTLDSYKKYKNLINISENFKSFDDTASALKNLDLFVTVDTSSAHIAGALGVKTLMILPYATDWRWFDDDKTTDWYDSIRIVKQKGGENWPDFFERLQVALDDLISTST